VKLDYTTKKKFFKTHPTTWGFIAEPWDIAMFVVWSDSVFVEFYHWYCRTTWGFITNFYRTNAAMFVEGLLNFSTSNYVTLWPNYVTLWHIRVPITHKHVTFWHIRVAITHICVTLWHIRVTLWHIRVPITHICVTLWHIRVTLWHICVAITHICVTLWHIRVPITHKHVTFWHIRVTLWHNFFLCNIFSPFFTNLLKKGQARKIKKNPILLTIMFILSIISTEEKKELS